MLIRFVLNLFPSSSVAPRWSCFQCCFPLFRPPSLPADCAPMPQGQFSHTWTVLTISPHPCRAAKFSACPEVQKTGTQASLLMTTQQPLGAAISSSHWEISPAFAFHHKEDKGCFQDRMLWKGSYHLVPEVTWFMGFSSRSGNMSGPGLREP